MAKPGRKKGGEKTGGRKPSKSLFKQFAANPEDALYDLDEMHDVFVELGDLTEYKPAMQLVGSWAEWERLKNNSTSFQQHINEWKKEISIRNTSDAQEKILSLIHSPQASVALSAAKWFAENGPEKRQGAGRPSRKELQAREKAMVSAAEITKREMKRVKNVVEFKKAGGEDE